MYYFVYNVCVRVRARVCACVRACVRACMRACVRECVRACVSACVRACVYGVCSDFNAEGTQLLGNGTILNHGTCTHLLNSRNATPSSNYPSVFVSFFHSLNIL